MLSAIRPGSLSSASSGSVPGRTRPRGPPPARRGRWPARPAVEWDQAGARSRILAQAEGLVHEPACRGVEDGHARPGRLRARRVGAAYRRPLSSDLARQTHWHLSGWTGQTCGRAETGRPDRRCCLPRPVTWCFGDAACRSCPARPANRDSHELAVDTGTLHESPARPGDRSRSRAATDTTFNPAARNASAAKITGAAYRRRDSSQAGSSTCDRPQPRQTPRRGRSSADPASIATRRGRACPHGRSLPPHQQARRPALRRASTDFCEPRTVTTVVPPAPLGRPSRHQVKDQGGPLPMPTWPRCRRPPARARHITQPTPQRHHQ